MSIATATIERLRQDGAVQDSLQEQVLAFLRDFTHAYEVGGAEFFEFFSENATFFTQSSPTRIDSREEYKRLFEQHFKVTASRKSQILSPQVECFGDAVLVSYHQRISIDKRSISMRVSVFLTKDRTGDLTISHLHISPLPTPSVAAGPKTVEDITVLEERVATAAATVGTPK